MNYTLQQLRIFISIYELKSLRQSAEVMFLTPPALTKQLQNLEDILGFRLFERANNKLIANNKGRAFYALIKPMLLEFDRINQLELPFLKHKKPTLKIALSQIFEQSLFCKISQIMKLDQSFDYDLVVENKTKHIELLLKHEVDVALVVLNEGEKNMLKDHGFEIKLYTEIVFDVYVACDLAKKFKDIKQDLKTLKCILQTQVKDTLQIKNALYFSSYTTILHAITQGIGYGFLPTALLSTQERKVLLNINQQISENIPNMQSYYVYAQSSPLLSLIEMAFSTR
ncbi:LysR family transcriptional regulator [Cysteiniphilum halobium]|uniref:LysR family transcriptional regulator n=1 Tax=Cysteiniphilum halobium TaxID=2219059 RepID=UPI003F844E1E